MPTVDSTADAAPDPATDPAPDRVFALPGAPDAVCAAAVEPARAAAQDEARDTVIGTDAVGEHLGMRAEAERVVTHAFAAALPGYVGWYWAVTVARASRSRTATVDEVVLLPGAGALAAPHWVPWSERVQPGDLSPGDLLPPRPDDTRLVPAYTLSDDPAVEQVAFELGVGREQVMSRDGRLDAAERWHDEHGPNAPMARQAPAPCGTCGFLLPLAGALSAGFGVCGNEVTDTDGQVVSVEYGCGAHSQGRQPGTELAVLGEIVYDDGDEITPAEPVAGASSEPAEPSEPSEPAEPSEGAAQAAVPQHDQPAEDAEQPAGE